MNTIYGIAAGVLFWFLAVVGASVVGLLFRVVWVLYGSPQGTVYTVGTWQDSLTMSMSILFFHLVVGILLKKDGPQ